MTAREILEKYYVANQLPSEEQVIEAMIEYAEKKCLKVFRNTRYAAMEIVLEELVGTDKVALDLIQNRIQNIKWSEVKPEFE